MKIRTRHALLSVSAVLVTVLATISLATFAIAEPHPEIHEYRTDLADGWMFEAAGIAPYTVPTTGEAKALEAAANALIEPPLVLIRNADHGYEQCLSKLEDIRALGDAEPMLVGHELVLENEAYATRVFVYGTGVVRFIEAGPQAGAGMPKRPLSGSGELDAAEIAHSAFCLHSSLAPDSPYCEMHPSVTAYGIGFADEGGTHLVVRVGADGAVSCPEW